MSSSIYGEIEDCHSNLSPTPVEKKKMKKQLGSLARFHPQAVPSFFELANGPIDRLVLVVF